MHVYACVMCVGALEGHKGVDTDASPQAGVQVCEATWCECWELNMVTADWIQVFWKNSKDS